MNWNIRYAVETPKSFEQAWGGTPTSAEETLNRLIPTTSDKIRLLSDKISGQMHELDRPFGNLEHIFTFIDPTGMKYSTPATAYLGVGHDNANEALNRHFEEQPIDLPNKVYLEHPDNHWHILHRVKSFIASHM